MVCMGNICRSPLAEGIMQSKLNADFVVDSAGTIDLHQGECPDRRAIKVAGHHGIDISQQKSRPFRYSDFELFDKIYCMDIQNLQDVFSLAKTETDKSKVSLILDVLQDENLLEVPDPYWDGEAAFEEVYQLLDQACDRIAQKLMTN